jgi:hypothetical protein
MSLTVHRCLPLVALLCVCGGCQTRVTGYTLLSTRKVDVSRMETFSKEARPVNGKFTVLALGKIPLSLRGAAYEITGRSNNNWQINQAIDRALDKLPGAVAMADVTLYDTMFSIPFLWEYRSCTVRGKPVIDPTAPDPDRRQPLASGGPFPHQSVP